MGKELELAFRIIWEAALADRFIKNGYGSVS
jgi:hypothetical protein